MDFTAEGIDGIAARLASRRASVADIVEACLAGIAQQAALNAFVTVAAAEARERARRLDALPPRARGSLHGIPYAVKDVMATRGIPTSHGSRVEMNTAPDAHASVVSRLDAAGAVLVGKLNLWELAMSGPSPQGEATNPWSAAHSPGGSSSGSGAAVAAGLLPFTLGTDTGGSIRVPAAWCGVTGLRPTYGRVPVDGVTVNAWTIDTVGPLAARAADAARVFAVIADQTSEHSPPPRTLRGLRLGVPRRYFFEDLHPEVGTAIDRALGDLTRLGLQPVDVDIPHAGETAVVRTVHMAEAAQYHEQRLARQSERFGAALRARLEEARRYTATDYIKALRVRTLLQDEVRAAFERCDLFLTPTDVNPPPPLRPFTREAAPARNAGNTFLASLTGIPSLALPAGFTTSVPRLPVSMLLHARPFDEALLFAVSEAYQSETLWHLQRPD